MQKRVDELTKENERLQADNMDLLEKLEDAVYIKFDCEDELPEMDDDVYTALFNCSHVDIVRLFPYIEENGEKYYLVNLEK